MLRWQAPIQDSEGRSRLSPAGGLVDGMNYRRGAAGMVGPWVIGGLPTGRTGGRNGNI